MKKIILLVSLILSSSLLSQQYTAKYINSEIVIDGEDIESDWMKANSGSNFWQWRPTDSLQAVKQTEFKALYDDENLYFFIKAYTEEKNFTVYSLKRDFNTFNTDYVQLIFDTFNDATNAFQFQTNHLGLKGDVLVSGGNVDYRTDRNSSWDAIWDVESKINDDNFSIEIKIPFDQLFFTNGAKKWRFNMYRSDTQTLEHSTWTKIPQNQSIGNLAFMGELIFEKSLGKSKKPVSVIPYLNISRINDFEINKKYNKSSYGVDLKIPVGNSLNLDITVNPDFSQVEVDDQIVNITQWETRLPEKRQFFTQNSDLFNDFGQPRDAEPFFSRRLGVATNKYGEIVENKIISGLRLSGKINDNLRIGFLNVLTEENLNEEVPQNNNTLLTFRNKVFSRSNYTFFLINRENTKEYDFVEESDKYNRVLGFEYNLASNDGNWRGRTFIHKSFSSGSQYNNNYSYGVSLYKNSRNHDIGFNSSFVGDDFNSDLGYYRRKGFFKFQPTYRYRIYPKNEKILNYEFTHFAAFVYRPNKENTFEGQWNLTTFEIKFLNQSEFRLRQNIKSTYLYDSFDPTRTKGAVALEADILYKYTDYEIEYNSPRRNLFNTRSKISFGEFFNGDKFSFENTFSYRKQPVFNAELKLNFDSIKLPEPFPSRDIWLISPKFEFTFSKKTFWTTYIQFSSQSENLGINSRLQWRFAPLSDLYLVYNDNYYTKNSITPSLRSINLKLTYWINI